MTFREIEKKLKAGNWVFIRAAGLTCQYRKTGVPNAIYVTDQGDEEIAFDVVMSLEKKTGLYLRR